MTYEEYKESHAKRVFERLISAEMPLLSEEEFNRLAKPLDPTPPLSEDVPFRLRYKEMYLRIRKLIEGGNAEDKVEQLKILDETYNEVAAKLNLD